MPNVRSAIARVRVFVAALLFASHAGSALVGQPAIPAPVPDAQIGDLPHRWVGMVVTDYSGSDPAVQGSGWVASERVAVSAAHVFFVDETPGWNRNRWYWRRGMTPTAFMGDAQSQTPRTFRVLAGYASAAREEQAGTATLRDLFNRDSLALIFYQPLLAGPPAPRRVGGLADSGTFSLEGYPQVQGVPHVFGQMLAHAGGAAATFERLGGAEDKWGAPNAVFRSAHLRTGGGGSGGPVFRLRDGTWEAVGVVVGEATDGSYAVAREIDASLEAVIEAARVESESSGPGTVDWIVDGVFMEYAPLRRENGTVVVMGQDGLLAFDSEGRTLWRRPMVGVGSGSLAEMPDGRIVFAASGGLVMLEGDTGRELWRKSLVSWQNSIAVTEAGEIAVANGGYVALYDADGARLWEKTVVDSSVWTPTPNPPAVGADGTIYVGAGGRVHALARTDGAIRWSSSPIDGLRPRSIALTADGGVVAAGTDVIRVLNPDGSERWLREVPGAGVLAPVLRGDGSILVPTGERGPVKLLDSAGSIVRELVFSGRLLSLTSDASGYVYLGLEDAVEAYAPTGQLAWRSQLSGGRVYMGRGTTLLCISWSDARMFAYATAAAAAPGLWEDTSGGLTGTRRVFNSAALAPFLRQSPLGGRVVEGYQLVLEARASGSQPMVYEWRLDGVLLPAFLGRRLEIPAAAAGDAGSYTVTVRNPVGSVVSAPAVIEVGAARFGDVLWSSEFSSAGAPAVADDGHVYAISFTYEGMANLKAVDLLAIRPAGGEAWRFDLLEGGASFGPSQPPVIGDDGRIFVAARGNVWAVSPEGRLLWRKVGVTGQYSTAPTIALAPASRLYIYGEGNLGLYGYDGTAVWERSVERPSYGSILVRRDGAAVLNTSPVTVIGVDGVQIPIASTGMSYLAMIGPADEIITQSGQVIDAAGVIVREGGGNPSPRIMLTNGMVVGGSMQPALTPFMGSGTKSLALQSVDNAAACDGGRFIATQSYFGVVARVEASGEVSGTFTIPRNTGSQEGGEYTLGPDGRLVGGSPLKAYFTDSRGVRSPWSQVRGDARNSRRAPADQVLTPSLVRSVTISGAQAFAGYPLTLTANIEGTGPLSIQWQRNGRDIRGATGLTLRVDRAGAGDAGEYSVIVTNQAGTVASLPHVVSVNAPAPAPPGVHFGRYERTFGGPPALAAIRVYADRSFEYVGIDSSGGRAFGRLSPEGAFTTMHLKGGSVVGDAFQVAGVPGFVPDHGAITGTLDNGMPAGWYAGYTEGSVANPVSMLLLRDGTIIYAREAVGGRMESATGAFAAGQRTAALPASVSNTAFDLAGDVEGVIRGQTPDYPASGLRFTAVWTGRPDQERMINLSTRGVVSPSQPPMIMGFVVSGSQLQPLLLRGVGPELSRFGVQAALPRPRASLMSGTGSLIQSNEGWANEANHVELADAMSRLSGLTLRGDSLSAAMYAKLQPGLYTMMVEPADAVGGVALVEVYEDLVAGGANRLVNLSTRGNVGSGEGILIGGFVVSGSVPKRFLIRAVGPSLAAFVGGAFPLASDPRIRLFKSVVGGSVAIGSNDNWGADWPSEMRTEAEAVRQRVGAFALGPMSRDAVMLVALEPGSYTAQVDNVSDTSGVALLEIYEIRPE